MFEDLFGYPKVLAIFDSLLSPSSPSVSAASGHSSLSSAAFSVRLAARRQFGRLPPQHARTTARRARFEQTLMMSPIELCANVLRRHSVPSARERKRTVGCALRASLDATNRHPKKILNSARVLRKLKIFLAAKGPTNSEKAEARVQPEREEAVAQPIARIL